jgi:predicted nucleic acid-binding protein
MTFLDSSVIIDYLDNVAPVVDYVDDQDTPYRTSSICVYEVLAGEVFSEGETNIEDARRTFDRIRAIDFSEEVAIDAARLQDRLLESGDPLSPRDLFVAATAWSRGDRLVVADADFETEGLADVMTVTNLRD